MSDHFPHTLQYPCLAHHSQNTTHLCIDPNCNSHPFLCPLCLNDFRSSSHSNHQHHIFPLFQALNNLSQQIQQRKYEVDKLIQPSQSPTLRSNKIDIDAVLKKFQDNQLTLKTFDTQIKMIKSQIQKDTDNLLLQFQKKLMVNKQNLFNEIDNYQKNYLQNYENFRDILQPISCFKKNLKYYSNINNIYLKIHNELKRKSSDWILSTKRIINQINRISTEKNQGFNDTMAKMNQNMSGEELPQYRNAEMAQSTKMRIQYFINENINDKLNLKGMKIANDAGMQEQYRGSGNHRIQKRFY